MVYSTVKSEFLNDLLDYSNTSIVNYISYNLEEQGNYDLEIKQIEQIKFLINEKARELEKRRKFSRLGIRKQTFKNNVVKKYVFIIY